jgi:hypothetical protein
MVFSATFNNISVILEIYLFFALNVHELLIVRGEFPNNLVKQVSPENIFFIYAFKISRLIN